MNIIDLTAILANLSQSLLSIGHLVLGVGYLLGIVFVITGFIKFTKINKQSREGPAVPIAYIVGGVVLIYLPASIGAMSSTFFGTNNILQYAPFKTFTLYDSMRVLIQTAGYIWFVRGTVLLVHASEPGTKEGSKGLLFVLASVFAINFNFTVDTISTIFAYFASMTSKVF